MKEGNHSSSCLVKYAFSVMLVPKSIWNKRE